jgi:hypothetical protein
MLYDILVVYEGTSYVLHLEYTKHEGHLLLMHKNSKKGIFSIRCARMYSLMKILLAVIDSS